MKKFMKQQWRSTVPNINTSIFKKSPSKDDLDTPRSKQGSYDVEKAQQNYNTSAHSVPNSIYLNSDTSESEDDTQNVRNRPRKSSMDIDLTDFNQDTLKSPNLSERNSKYEYEVPKISFQFFETSEVGSTISAPNDAYQNIEKPNKKEKHISEVKIMILTPEINIDDLVNDETYDVPPPQDSKRMSTISVSPETSINVPILRKRGSEPNISINDLEDDLYQIPRSSKRISRSLSDFDIRNSDSIEHISVSQIIVPQENNHKEQTYRESFLNVKNRLPLKVRKPGLLRRSNLSQEWSQFREKFNKMLNEHAAQQRVGAFESREKIINLDTMYKKSKTRCRRVFKTTGRIFKRTNKSNDIDSDSSSQIVKNDAFFARVSANDIEYKLNTTDTPMQNGNCQSSDFLNTSSASKSDKSITGDEFDFATIKSAFKWNKHAILEGQNGFDDLRRYVKQGSDFCKELAQILQERSEAETTYAKSLSKLSSKLSRACRDGVGGLNEAWKSVAVELETRAESHRILGNSLLEEAAKPLKTLTEAQQRTRKLAENAVDKAGKSLADWRSTEAKGKKHSHSCARENEKLQDASILDNSRLARSSSLIHLAKMEKSSDKETAKMEVKKKKAEGAVKKADVEYYSLCVRAERARLEWESSVLRGVNSFQTLEEERLNSLKNVLTSYLLLSTEHGPRLIEAGEMLRGPITQAEPTKDLSTLTTLRNSSQQISEQLLPDFYCEHITLAMNRERRKQALVKLLHLIRNDIERERKSKNGLENLSKAIKQTPNFGAEDSQQNVIEKLYHMKSMLTYLEGARYKVHSALAELDSRPRSGHPLATHITITRDKAGLQQSVLKVPQWLKEEWLDTHNMDTDLERSPLSMKSIKSTASNHSDKSDPTVNDIDDHEAESWCDRGAADGNSNQHDSDFDEFSSQCSSNSSPDLKEGAPLQPIAQCRAIYPYSANLTDELNLRPGDMLQVYRQQDDGWWLGECNGNVGIFPATYVEIISTV